MKIIRSVLTKDFVWIPNSLAQDDCLSHMARGCMTELIARPDRDEVTAEVMWRESVAEHGKHSPKRRVFEAVFAELSAAGYLVETDGSEGAK